MILFAYSLLLMLFSMISIDLNETLNGQLAKYIILMPNCVMLDLWSKACYMCLQQYVVNIADINRAYDVNRVIHYELIL
jgi:hypothetical protein